MPSASRPPTIVVFGSLNMDFVGVVDRLPKPGETIWGVEFFTAPGGKGANQAVAADLFGPMMKSRLHTCGVDVTSVVVDHSNKTGAAIVLLDAAKQNYIVAVYGANMSCDAEQVQ